MGRTQTELFPVVVDRGRERAFRDKYLQLIARQRKFYESNPRLLNELVAGMCEDLAALMPRSEDVFVEVRNLMRCSECGAEACQKSVSLHHTAIRTVVEDELERVGSPSEKTEAKQSTGQTTPDKNADGQNGSTNNNKHRKFVIPRLQLQNLQRYCDDDD